VDERERIGDLDALQRALRPCRRCVAAGIRVESMPVVSGRRDAEAILVGQAPGIRERENLRPFSGPAGRRLRDWLAPAGLGDEESFYGRLYIAAVVRCFPGKRPGGSDVRPSAAMVRECVPWLRRELQLVPAPLVIAVGTLALEELAPGVRLDDAVGVELRVADGRPLVALPHPSGASPWPHLPGNPERLERALRMIAVRLGGGGGAGVPGATD
jgi:uracil-DNA glycosylase